MAFRQRPGRGNAPRGEQRQDWCTPEPILRMIYELGPIGLDPCSNPQAIVKARIKWTEADNSIPRSWADQLAPREICFINPPYNKIKGKLKPDGTHGFGAKIAAEASLGMPAASLVPGNLCTQWFRQLSDPATGCTGVLALDQRPKHVGSKSGGWFDSAIALHNIELGQALEAAKRAELNVTPWLRGAVTRPCDTPCLLHSVDVAGELVEVCRASDYAARNLERTGHLLSKVSRFSGRGWSVLLHSIVAAQLAELDGAHPSTIAATALHDMCEAIFGDVMQPVKALTELETYEQAHLFQCFAHLKIPLSHLQQAKEYDRAALVLELRDLGLPAYKGNDPTLERLGLGRQSKIDKSTTFELPRASVETWLELAGRR